jgi:hypothetical protein
MNLKLVGLHEKLCSSDLELGNSIRIFLETDQNEKNKCRDGRSQDLPDAHY